MIIDRFQGNYRFLSNFWPATVEFEGDVYPTVEHAYQAAKTEVDSHRRRILEAKTPGQAKRFGRNILMRNDWDQVKEEIMSLLVHQKFQNHPDLQRKLLSTKPAQLVEGNMWCDQFWGRCYCRSCQGNGENRLGKILMEVRRKINDYK